jgi:hypothetical protein
MTGQDVSSDREVFGRTGRERLGLGRPLPDEHRRAHNPKVAGSNPAPATKKGLEIETSERPEVSAFKGVSNGCQTSTFG